MYGALRCRPSGQADALGASLLPSTKEYPPAPFRHLRSPRPIRNQFTRSSISPHQKAGKRAGQATYGAPSQNSATLHTMNGTRFRTSHPEGASKRIQKHLVLHLAELTNDPRGLVRQSLAVPGLATSPQNSPRSCRSKSFSSAGQCVHIHYTLRLIDNGFHRFCSLPLAVLA